MLCAALFLGWCAVAALVSPFLSRARSRRVGRLAIHRAFAFLTWTFTRIGAIEVDAGALDALRTAGPMLLAPNHPSMLDVVLVIARLPSVACIMKAALWDNPFLGAGARMAGYIRNDSAQSMVRQAVCDLREGSQLLVFPEATRTVRHPVNAFTRGYALIARRAAVPIQSIFIETDSPYLSKGWPLLRKPPLPMRFHLRLGRRFDPSQDIDALVAQMQHHYAEQLAARPSP
ncbi:MAG: lysophospholipid acyltransferase family protein [Lautropia sp.]